MTQDQATVAYVAIAAVLINFVVSLAKQESWPATVSFITALALSIIAGVVITWADGGFLHLAAPANYLAVVASVVAIDQSVYQTIWNKGVDQAVTGLLVAPRAGSAAATHDLTPGPELATVTHIEGLEAMVHDQGDRIVNALEVALERRPSGQSPPAPTLESFHQGEAGAA